ncbi:MAG: hypothetical protein E2P02_09960 [Acidobacteria bacterium]|nr:MAG: hypothetical protein E2P02_09960 [Acidobacteriota bacterium]
MSSAATLALAASRRWVPVAILVALPFLYHVKLFSPNPEERRIFRGDFLNQHYVWKSYALSRARSGELALWNPHVLGGVAIHANPLVGIFYPPTYVLLPFTRGGRVDYVALEIYQLLHQAFAGLGMLLLMRSIGSRPAGALLAALVFAFTGFFTTPGHHAIVITAAWIPWALFATRRAVRQSGVGSLAVLSATLALMVLAGHPQVAYYGLLLTALWAMACGGLKQSATRFLPALFLAIAIAAVQLIPTYRLAEDSSRAALGYEYATSFGFSPYFLAAAFNPKGQVRLPGQDDSAPLHLYVGIGTLLLAAVGFLLSETKGHLFFAACAAGALLLSFGRDSPLFDWFYAALPSFDRFRVPYRLLGIYTLAMSVLAGLGLSVLEEVGRKQRLHLRSIVRSAFALLLVLALWAAFMHTRVVTPSGSSELDALSPAQVERLVGGAYWAVLLAGIHVLFLTLILWRPREKWVIYGLVGVAVLDVGTFVKDRGERPYRTLVRAGERAEHRLVRAQSYRSRYVSESNLENYATLQGVDFAGGHEALVDGHYAELLDASHTSANALSLLNAKFIVRQKPPSAFPWCGPRYASPLPLLDIPPALAPARLELLPPVEASSIRLDWHPLGPGGTASVEVGAKVFPLEPDRPLELRFDERTSIDTFTVMVDDDNPGIQIESIELDLNPLALVTDFLRLGNIVINLHALPRAYFIVPSGIPEEIQTLEALRCWSVHAGIQVRHPESGEGASGFFRKDATEITIYEPELVEIRTRSPRAGFVVLADTLRPGWVAEVDGVETPVLRAQWSMRSAAVPAGEHVVRFRYQPRSLAIGMLVSLSAFLVLFGLFGLSIAEWRASRKKANLKPDEDFVSAEPE